MTFFVLNTGNRRFVNVPSAAQLKTLTAKVQQNLITQLAYQTSGDVTQLPPNGYIEFPTITDAEKACKQLNRIVSGHRVKFS